MSLVEEQFYSRIVELGERYLELFEEQTALLMGIYTRLEPMPKEPDPEPPRPVTGVPQIDAALAKQKAKLPGPLQKGDPAAK